MYRSILILYLICFGVYLLFTRQPDYFDAEKAPATIHFVFDSSHTNKIAMAEFSNGYKNFQVDANYWGRTWKPGEKTTVIYETDRPENGAVYAFWGYGISWGELLGSVLFLVVSFMAANSITQNPSASSLKEQIEYQPPIKPRYD